MLKQFHHWAANGSFVICFVISSLLVPGCGPNREVRILDGTVFGDKFLAALSLADYPRNRDASAALIRALKDADPAVRYAAAGSLESHLVTMAGVADRDLECKALFGLVAILDDTEIGSASYPAWGSFMPGVSGRTPSPRSRALLALSKSLLVDHGFDKDAWRNLINKRLACSMPATTDTALSSVQTSGSIRDLDFAQKIAAPILFVEDFWSDRPLTSKPTEEAVDFRLAVWSDGFVLMKRFYGLKSRWFSGRIDSSKVVVLMERIRRSGFFDQQSQIYAAPDSNYTVICARTDDVSNCIGFDSVGSAHFGDRVLASQDHQKFVNLWNEVMKTIDDSLPHDLGPLAENNKASIRGIGIPEYGDTVWRDHRLWEMR